MKTRQLTFFISVTLLSFGKTGAAQDQVISLYEGPAPGSENWDWQESYIEQAEIAYNIVSPTLTVYRAAPGTATGTGVIICPGGGFHFLSMENEGHEVALWLQAKGISAFVLKYRTEHCLSDNPIQEFMQKRPNTPEFNRAMEPIIAMAIADGKAAVAYAKEHAVEWGLSQDRIGIMGFSAGGTVTAGASITYDAGNRPDFAAPIYPYVGSFGDPEVPEDAPPLFIACASDDFFGFQNHCTKLYTQWNKEGKSAELIIYRKGGHGFGMRKQDLPTDAWIERFYEWLVHMED